MHCALNRHVCFHSSSLGNMDCEPCSNSRFGRSPDLFFTPMERQRLVMSIISARPADGGAGIDVSMLLAGKVWRVPLSAPEEAAELAREAEQFGWPAPVPLSDLPPPPPGAFGDQVARLRSVAFRTHHVCSAVFEAFLCTHSPRARFQLAGRINAFPPSILGRPPLDELREYFGEKASEEAPYPIV